MHCRDHVTKLKPKQRDHPLKFAGFHNQSPLLTMTQLITSSAVYMASCLVDIHPTIMAVARPLHTPIHRVVHITIKGEEIDCYGGIDIQIVNQKMQQALANMKKPFMKQLPPLMLQLSPKELHESLRQLRQVIFKRVEYNQKTQIYYTVHHTV